MSTIYRVKIAMYNVYNQHRKAFDEILRMKKNAAKENCFTFAFMVMPNLSKRDKQLFEKILISFKNHLQLKSFVVHHTFYH